MRFTLVCVVALLSAQFAFAQTEPAKTKDIKAEISTERWKGWGGGEPLPEALKSLQPAQKFERVKTPDGQKPTFTGKVIGLEAGVPAEIGVVNLIRVHWGDNKNYEWSPIKDDGSFEAKADLHPEARHALVVKSEGHPWTFLRAEFEANESAKDIELQSPPDKQILITVEKPDGKPAAGFAIEVFNAYEMYDDAGKKLRPQRYGRFNSKAGELVLPVPMEPVAFLIASPGLAPYFHVLDPREADHFNYKLLGECVISGTVTRDGKPVEGQQVFMVNEAAPLSASIRKTDKDGKFSVPGRVPGHHRVEVAGKEEEMDLKEGEKKDLVIDLTGVEEPKKQ